MSIEADQIFFELSLEKEKKTDVNQKYTGSRESVTAEVSLEILVGPGRWPRG